MAMVGSRRQTRWTGTVCVLAVLLQPYHVACFLLPVSLGYLGHKHSEMATFHPPTSLAGSPTSKKALRRKKDGSSSTSESETTPDNYGQIPANLRRKISAKRPALGHVVPREVRKAQKLQQQMQTAQGGSRAPQLRAQGKQQVGLGNPSMLKIVAGTARGRKLDSPSVYLRPMMGKVREAVFSTFTSFGLYDADTISSGGKSAIRNCRHLDLFAGSGSVGLESLSRGATHCTFVDLSDDCCATIQRNVEICQFDDDKGDDSNNGAGRVRIVQADALQILRDPESVLGGLNSADGVTTDAARAVEWRPSHLLPFNIVTICPPYEEIVYGDLLEAIVSSDLVQPDTVVLVEYPVELGCLPHVIQSQRNTTDEQQETSSKTSFVSSNSAMIQTGLYGSAGSDGRRYMVGVRNRRYGRTVIAIYVVNPTGKLSGAAQSRPEDFVSLK